MGFVLVLVYLTLCKFIDLQPNYISISCVQYVIIGSKFYTYDWFEPMIILFILAIYIHPWTCVYPQSLMEKNSYPNSCTQSLNMKELDEGQYNQYIDNLQLLENSLTSYFEQQNILHTWLARLILNIIIDDNIQIDGMLRPLIGLHLCKLQYFVFLHTLHLFTMWHSLGITILLEIHVEHCLTKVDYFKILICSFTIHYLHIITKPKCCKRLNNCNSMNIENKNKHSSRMTPMDVHAKIVDQTHIGPLLYMFYAWNGHLQAQVRHNRAQIVLVLGY